MRLNHKVQKEIVKEYIRRNEELFRELATQEHYNKLDDETWFNPDISNERKKYMLEDYVLNDEVLNNLYTTKRNKGKLSDFFRKTSKNGILTELSHMEKILVNNYLKKRDGKHTCFEDSSLLPEAQYLQTNNNLWKLFENEAKPKFLIPLRNDE
tara:strand:- start:532 stop:993 length:462 start_codon:yes stop_codon:yes gene_type:complete